MAAKGAKRRRPGLRRQRAAGSAKAPPRGPCPTSTSWLGLLLSLLWACIRPRASLVLENAALRHQLGVLRRSVKRPRLTDRDRLVWIALASLFPRWRECLLIVRPDTVVRWHRKGWRAWCRWRSRRRRLGRPPIGWKLVCLIHRLARENPTWGSDRVRNELLLLGHDIGETTVARYMPRRRWPGRGQGWMTFLRNHMGITAACDFLVVPSVTFRSLFVFVVLSHDRRRIRHVAVTEHPTAEWTARQILEAFPGGEEPAMLLRDNDSIYGDDFSRMMRTLAIRELRTPYRSPWLNPYCERVNGTLRRDVTDHVIALNAAHLQRILRAYVADYYNTARPHMSLEGNAPIPRTRETTPVDDVVATPVVGGLHHTYRRAA